MPAELHYFHLGGRAEGIRALLGHANFQYQDERMNFTDFGEVKDQTPLGSLPVWTEDGFQMCQSSAILRMLGIRLGYYTEDPAHAWAIDSLVDFAESFQGKIVGYIFPAVQGGQVDVTKADEWLANGFDKLCAVYEKRLAGHGKKYLAGDKLTIADFKCFQHWITASECNTATPLPREVLDKQNACIAKYSNVARWVETMKGELADYLKNKRVPSPI